MNYHAHGLAVPASAADDVISSDRAQGIETDIDSQVSALRSGDWYDRDGNEIPDAVREAWLADFRSALCDAVMS